MKAWAILLPAAIMLAGCSLTADPMAFSQIDLPDRDTDHLCWIVAKSRNHEHRLAAANLLARRKAAVPPCKALLAADFAMIGGIATAASAAGATRTSGGYAVAWDRFVTEGGQALWQCREIGSGQFVYNYLCLGKQLHDGVWAGDDEPVFVDQPTLGPEHDGAERDLASYPAFQG